MEAVQAGATQRDWRDVVSRLAPPAELTTGELALLAEARWWLCDMPEATRLEEHLHERLREEARPVEAASVALRVCLMWALRGDLTLSEAWLGRASPAARGPAGGRGARVRRLSDGHWRPGRR